MPGLREIAEADLAVTMEDEVYGFGTPVEVIDPDGLSGDLSGISGDIGLVIDPDTGTAISGRFAHVDLRISSLTAKGLGLPQGIADAKKKPWIIKFSDIQGLPYIFKVQSSAPDRSLGVVTCTLETYKE